MLAIAIDLSAVIPVPPLGAAHEPSARRKLAVPPPLAGARPFKPLVKASSSAVAWVPVDGRPPAKIEFPSMRVQSLRLNPDGKTIVSFSPKEAHLWDLASSERLLTLEKFSGIKGADFSPDGRWLAIADAENKKNIARVWDVKTGTVKVTLPASPDEARSINFSPDGKLLATATDKSVQIWDAATGQLLATLDEARFPVAFSPDGHLLATGGRKDTALLWELPSK